MPRTPAGRPGRDRVQARAGKRFFGHGELHLVLLSLLARRPMHGYDLMAELSRLYGPAYQPSAGSIYPALLSLHAEGLVESQETGGRKTFTLTDVGATALADRADAVAALEVRTGVRLTQHEEVDGALARFASRVLAVADRIDHDALEALLDRLAGEIERRAADPARSRRTP